MIKRRHFLRGAGASLAVPALGSLARGVRASTPPIAGIRRVVFITTRYGSVHYNWFPSDESRNGTLRLGDRARVTELGSFRGDLSPVFQDDVWSLPATGGTLKDHLLMLDGVDAVYQCGHSNHYALNGHPAGHGTLLGPSIDQLIARRGSLAETAYRSLHIKNGAGAHSASSRPDPVTGRAVAVPEIAEPQHVWDQIFAGLMEDTGNAKEIAQLAAERRSVIDHVAEDFDRLRNNPRVSRADRQRLDAYMSFVREIEMSRTRPDVTSPSCTVPERAATRYLTQGNFNDSQRGRDHITNIIHAIRCGVTNVITFATCPGARAYRDLGATISNFHSTTHNRDGTRELVRDQPGHASIRQSLIHERHHAGLLAQLMQGLDVVEDVDTGRTFLDNTLIVLTSGMGSHINHRGTRMPIVLAGAKGVLNTGKLIDFRSEFTNTESGRGSVRTGVLYNKLLITLAQLMGLTRADYGMDGFGSYRVFPAQARAFPSAAAYEAFAIGDKHEPLRELLTPSAGGLG